MEMPVGKAKPSSSLAQGKANGYKDLSQWSALIHREMAQLEELMEQQPWQRKAKGHQDRCRGHKAPSQGEGYTGQELCQGQVNRSQGLCHGEVEGYKDLSQWEALINQEMSQMEGYIDQELCQRKAKRQQELCQGRVSGYKALSQWEELINQEMSQMEHFIDQELCQGQAKRHQELPRGCAKDKPAEQGTHLHSAHLCQGSAPSSPGSLPTLASRAFPIPCSPAPPGPSLGKFNFPRELLIQASPSPPTPLQPTGRTSAPVCSPETQWVPHAPATRK
ncbi:uncharacterized protein LOC114070481 [Empidonax traillii]|uniref:uncharacterized protein LOC114070481 n=1 Tax=Empidonax traillii TaxID=164674 RepID=UPI000FFD15E2|nr:uncharacterized protein LOC114070481 [Empidonax traillii]